MGTLELAAEALELETEMLKTEAQEREVLEPETLEWRGARRPGRQKERQT